MAEVVKKATRQAYGDALAELGAKYDKLVVLDADLAKATMTITFKNAFPERFFDCGIAEANLMGVAAGLSTEGFIPFASTFAMFAAGRAFEQVRNTIGYPHLNVKIGATHAGVSVGEDGATHQCNEDIALMRTIPGMTIINPADYVEAKAAVEAAINYNGPVYLRFGRLACPIFNDESTYKFELGKGITLKDGTDVDVYKRQEFALSYVDGQREQFKRLGVLGDFEHPYLTLKPEFEAEQVKVFGEMAKKGYIYKGLKPVYWCPDCVTALAEAEIEYANDPCDSVYVKFQLKDDKGLFDDLSIDKEKVYFVIWTTTTWTLPANLAICLGPNIEYSLVAAAGEYYILATDLIKPSMEAAGIESYEILKTFYGSEAEYMKARHPFMDRDSLIIIGDHVTLESGTGCVHTAPGHGVDDFVICQNSVSYTHLDVYKRQGGDPTVRHDTKR